MISSIFLGSFSQVFYFLGKDIFAKQSLANNDPNTCSINNPITDYDSLLETFMTLFRICMNGMNVRFKWQCL